MTRIARTHESMPSSLVTGLGTIPRVVAFGTVPAGKEASMIVALYDLSRKGRVVERVTSNNPKCFSARLLSGEDRDHEQEPLAGRPTHRSRGSAPAHGRQLGSGKRVC